MRLRTLFFIFLFSCANDTDSNYHDYSVSLQLMNDSDTEGQLILNVRLGHTHQKAETTTIFLFRSSDDDNIPELNESHSQQLIDYSSLEQHVALGQDIDHNPLIPLIKYRAILKSFFNDREVVEISKSFTFVPKHYFFRSWKGSATTDRIDGDVERVLMRVESFDERSNFITGKIYYMIDFSPTETKYHEFSAFVNADDLIDFQLQNPLCVGMLNGEGSIDGPLINASFEGSDCLGRSLKLNLNFISD